MPAALVGLHPTRLRWRVRKPFFRYIDLDLLNSEVGSAESMLPSARGPRSLAWVWHSIDGFPVLPVS